MAQLTAAGLTKAFGRVRAVEDVSFRLEEAERLAVLGPSACGKTTLLRLIAGFETPDRGEIHCDGQTLLGTPPEARRFGFVFQSYALFPHLSVRRNIAFGIRGPAPAVRRRTDALLELVGLAGVHRRRPSALSAGQRQRVALARALGPGPRLLLLDEPFSALDAQLRQGLRTELLQLQSTLGLSMIHVTHDRVEALVLGTRVAVLHDGRLEQIDTPQAVFERPASLAVARILGAGVVLDGVIRGQAHGRVRIGVGGAQLELPEDQPWRAGERVAVLVPERAIRLGAASPGMVALRAEIAAAAFEGDRRSIELRTPLGALRSHASITEAPIPGSSVEIGLDPACLRIYPRSAGAGGSEVLNA
jgi:ABC-type Fe3+/spermidine/putrescine transport system ATPase subunit